MKILLAAALALSLLPISRICVEAYDPYYYSYDAPAVEYPAAYDPYYELHVIHYQLYRPRYYPVYYQPYIVGPAPAFIVDRRPRAIRVAPMGRRR